MATQFEIPLSPEPQVFGINLAGIGYRLTFTYADAVNGGWHLDIADQNGLAIVGGIMLVQGIDLLAQYLHLKFGGEMRFVGDPENCAFDGLGVTHKLYFTTP